MHYAFDLRLVCGGYAYFRTTTRWRNSDATGRELREPSGVDAEQFGRTLNTLGNNPSRIESIKDLNVWLYKHGWGLVPAEFAREHMTQWLKKRYCVRSALGTFTDTAIVSPGTLKRNLRSKAKDAITSRDGKRCLACGSIDKLTLHHILAHSRGGETSSRNLATLCEACNQIEKAEENIALYEAAGLSHSFDPSIVTARDITYEVYIRAAQISGNLMQTRCEVW